MKTPQVLTKRHGAITLLLIAHPPVNCLSQPVRQLLWDQLVAADEDASVQAIVLAGAGRGFCAGGDLREMGSPLQQAWPGISNDLLPRIEACGKPVVAALHGFAVGGGLELALACHYRVAQRSTRIALPEMNHGVIPPSGSQRLPRALGVARALALIVTGDTVLAETLVDGALFDALSQAEGEAAAVAAGLEFAARLEGRQSHRAALLRHRPMAVADAALALSDWRRRIAAQPGASAATGHCITAVEHAVTAPDFDSGLRAAKRLHDELSAQRVDAAASR